MARPWTASLGIAFRCSRRRKCPSAWRTTRTTGARWTCWLRDRWRTSRSEIPARPRRSRRSHLFAQRTRSRSTPLTRCAPAVLPQETTDPIVLDYAHRHACLLVTCNRDDFIDLARRQPHHGIVVVIRRKSRASERAALFLLLERAGENGLTGNINFA